MTNQQHVDLLKQGTDAWNIWRQTYPTIMPDLHEEDLSGLQLNEANLRNVNFSGAKLSGAALSKANLEYANLVGADLSKVNLSEANLQGADLSAALLTEANLTEITSTNPSTMPKQ